MAMKVQRVDTWAAPLEDKPGSLAARLDALSKGGASLEFVIARRAPDRPGTGVVFVASIRGARGARAARKAGFQKTKSLHTVRIEGRDKRGQGALITQRLAEKGLNLRGLSGAAIGAKFVAYLALDTAAEAGKAASVLRGL
jgi:hypothetical protein